MLGSDMPKVDVSAMFYIDNGSRRRFYVRKPDLEVVTVLALHNNVLLCNSPAVEV